MVDHLPGCSCCGMPLDAMSFDIRSELPDAMLALTSEQRDAAWGTKSLRRLDGVGGFVRCLMPVTMTGGTSITYSVWLKVDDDQFNHVAEVWHAPDYAGLTLRGEVANAVKPWAALLGEAASAEVRDADGAIAMMREGSPQPAGELSEQDGDLLRHAFWVRAQHQFELYGYAATSTTIACVICMYDDVTDLAWAQEVWRSLRVRP